MTGASLLLSAPALISCCQMLQDLKRRAEIDLAFVLRQYVNPRVAPGRCADVDEGARQRLGQGAGVEEARNLAGQVVHQKRPGALPIGDQRTEERVVRRRRKTPCTGPRSAPLLVPGACHGGTLRRQLLVDAPGQHMELPLGFEPALIDEIAGPDHVEPGRAAIRASDRRR